MRAPTSMPAPNVDVDSSIAPSSAILAAPMPPAMPASIPPPSLFTERRSSTGSVRARRMLATARPGRKGELQAIDEQRREEHPDAGAVHPDAEHVEDHLPHRRLLHAHPHHRLDEHAHRTHAGDRGRGSLHVVGAVLAVGAVAVGDRRAQDAGQHLPADEEAEREVHVRSRHAAQRAQHQDAEADEEGVILPGARLRQPRPAAQRRVGGGVRLHRVPIVRLTSQRAPSSSGWCAM